MKKALYLNIIWHQHQPLYVDPETDQLQGPWVRTHATKDYYDMVSILEKYPNIHFTVNLTSSLLFQLQEYYVNRLRPFLNRRKNRIASARYFARFGGKTDPWIDLALKPPQDWTERDLNILLHNTWNAFGVSDVMIERFPDYLGLKKKMEAGKDPFTEQELIEIIFWFFLAHFDPDFLEGRIELITGSSVDLTDLIRKEKDGTYWPTREITSDDCNRIVAESVKIMEAIIPLHRKFMYDHQKKTGQIEIITTPFYHPILPLIYDSDVARTCQLSDPLPQRFLYPADAYAQVEKSISYFSSLFEKQPAGMWPAEGSVSQQVIPVFQKNNIIWIATDEEILSRSTPEHLPKYYPYTVGEGDKPIVVFFRDTELSDKIGFVYKNLRGEEAALDFIEHALRYAPEENEPDRLLTVILDGENAWEWYKHDPDGKKFLHNLYTILTELQEKKEVITVTPIEYIEGNPERGVPAHPVKSMNKVDWLWPGSWINANYDTWIGDREENTAWEYLRITREDLEVSGIPRPDVTENIPRKGTKKWYAYMAWESMYAAEGSDWFWWYGTDQSAPAGDKPFDAAMVAFLNNVYRFARLAGGMVPDRQFEHIATRSEHQKKAQGTMARSTTDLVRVVFQCDARDQYVRKSIYIAGGHELLGNWVPNQIRMYDDGSCGDASAGDGIWTLELFFPPEMEIEYKYTNSGPHGEWNHSEEFPGLDRKISVDKHPGETLYVSDKFGVLAP